MGWDAYSLVPRTLAEMQNPQHVIAFKESSKTIVEKFGSVDGSLSNGGLGLSYSASMLEKASEKTGEDVLGFFFHPYQDDELTPDQVKVLNERLNWNFEIEKGDEAYLQSAKEFIRVCSDLGVGIRFSY